MRDRIPRPFWMSDEYTLTPTLLDYVKFILSNGEKNLHKQTEGTSEAIGLSPFNGFAYLVAAN